MARNGSGTYSLYTPGNPVVTGTTVSSSTTNNTLNDIASALSQSIAADGQTPITADIPMNSHKMTGLAAGTTAGDALSYGQSGATLTAAVLTSTLGVALTAVKTSATSRSLTTVAADDPDLKFTLPAGVWKVDAFLYLSSVGAGGITADLAIGGTTMSSSDGTRFWMANDSVLRAGTTNNGYSQTAITNSTLQPNWLHYQATVTAPGGTSLSVQWAQASSNAATSSVQKNSYLTALKVG